MVLFQHESNAALAGLAIHTNHCLVVTADITRIDREVGNLPRFVRLLQASAHRVGRLAELEPMLAKADAEASAPRPARASPSP